MDTPAQNDPSAPAPVITSNTAAEDKGKSLKKVAIILGGFIVLIIISELAPNKASVFVLDANHFRDSFRFSGHSVLV